MVSCEGSYFCEPLPLPPCAAPACLSFMLDSRNCCFPTRTDLDFSSISMFFLTSRISCSLSCMFFTILVFSASSACSSSWTRWILKRLSSSRFERWSRSDCLSKYMLMSPSSCWSFVRIDSCECFFKSSMLPKFSNGSMSSSYLASFPFVFTLVMKKPPSLSFLDKDDWPPLLL